MMKENETIRINGEDLIEAVNEIEIMLTSIDKIFSYFTYVDKRDTAFNEELSRFIVDWKVLNRLARVRKILSENFDDTLGDDDMDDLERAAHALEYWKKPGSKPK
ncbi:hypothetical protein [Undibacterium sp.]|uniref:hypothetical protein n=1 Tax=Undibacterium sp. TaxID=1914977 RepID=UPI003751E58B